MDEHGNKNPDLAIRGISIEEEKKEEVEKCFNNEKTDPCDRGYYFWICFWIYFWTCMNEISLKSQQNSDDS